MFRLLRVTRAGLLSILTFLLATFVAVGLVGEGFDSSWSIIAGGGGHSASGEIALSDAVGQAVASNAPSFGGQRYSLTDGLWASGPAEREIHLPLLFAGN